MNDTPKETKPEGAADRAIRLRERNQQEKENAKVSNAAVEKAEAIFENPTPFWKQVFAAWSSINDLDWMSEQDKIEAERTFVATMLVWEFNILKNR